MGKDLIFKVCLLGYFGVGNQFGPIGGLKTDFRILSPLG